MAKRSRATNTWIIVGLAAFVVADLALIGFALRGPTDGESVSAVEPDFTLAPAPASTPASTPAATSAPAVTGTATPVPPGATSAPTSSASPTSPSTSAPSTSAASPGSTSPAPTDIVTSMASSSVGYRATAGTCDGDSTATDSVIELTTDGGATWTNVNPTDLRVRAVEKMLVVDASHVDLLARYGDDCTQSDITTYTQGEFWQVYPDRAGQFN